MWKSFWEDLKIENRESFFVAVLLCVVPLCVIGLFMISNPSNDSEEPLFGADVTNDSSAALIAAVHSEDSAFVSGDAGISSMSVRSDTPIESSGADGDYQVLKSDDLGALWVRELYVPDYEDNVRDVAAVAFRPLADSTYTWDVINTTSTLEDLIQVKSTAGVVRSIDLRIDSTGLTDSVYLQAINTSTIPVNGTVSGADFLFSPVKLQHTNGTDTKVTVDLLEAGIYASNGIVLLLSDTEFTTTRTSSIGAFNVRYK